MNRRVHELAIAIACAGIVACGAGRERVGAVSVVAMALTSSDVMRASVTITGPGIDPPLVVQLASTGGRWSGTIGGIPVGTDRTFPLEAFDGAGVKLYEGRATGVTITAGATTMVAITAQQVASPTPFANAAPIIDALVASTNAVAPGETISLSARAHDPNPGDTLTISWQASSGGSFSSANSLDTIWTAPSATGNHELRVNVSDPHGTTATMSLFVIVDPAKARGGAAVTVSVNTWPTISRVAAGPTRVDVNQATSLSVLAQDADGDPLSFAWSADCAGQFDSPTMRTPNFRLAFLPASGTCTLSVNVSDGRQGTNTGRVTITTGPGAATNLAPQVTSTFQSSESANGAASVTLRVGANDPEGRPLAFTWSRDVGTLGTASQTGGTAEIVWTAPSCFAAGTPANISVAISDDQGATTSFSFIIQPGPTTGCMDGFREEFNAALSPTEWVTEFTPGAASVSVVDGNLVLQTVPNSGCGAAQARSLRSFSVADGTVHFTSNVLDAYVDHAIYGDAQPRGLVAGANRDNAIEFINAHPVPNHVKARTVANGVATETTVNIGHSVRGPAIYEFVATATGVQFVIDGNVVATHTTNIPQVPLNAYFSTSDSCAGNVPVVVDWVTVQLGP